MTTQQADKTTEASSAQSRTETDTERLERLPRVLEAYAKDIDRYGKPMDSGLAPVLRFAAEMIPDLTTATAARLDAERKVAEMLREVRAAIPAIDMVSGHYGTDRRIDPLMELKEIATSTTLGQGWMSRVEWAAAEEEKREMDGKMLSLVAKLSELECEVAELAREGKGHQAQAFSNADQRDTFRERCARLEDALRGFMSALEDGPENCSSMMCEEVMERAEQALARSSEQKMEKVASEEEGCGPTRDNARTNR
jgi:hypothetical protein